VPDKLGRDQKNENTRNERGLCFMKQCTGKLFGEVTYFGRKRMMCKAHQSMDGVK
jgi:hypothetical protein